MLTLGTVVMGVSDVERAVRFWQEALGYVLRDPVEDGWAVLIPVGRPGPGLALTVSETPARHHPRTHLDLYAADAAEQAAEVERLLSLGAERVDWDLYPEDPDFVVLTDPEGNPFCVIDTAHG
ncbi:VOC family protein [Streptomyces sp. MNU89]|uniref:VOC family protein n=1 Tax=Streptomyces sp. MNU89 TaxID=2560025 RepID=UPI001E4472D2|nr:VOC family protein [Streptomyces sp. MNU89]MCC9742275.1 VOC family protein [Streptomyces sp. MNU89]